MPHPLPPTIPVIFPISNSKFILFKTLFKSSHFSFDKPYEWGATLCEDDDFVGYAYLTMCYSCQMGGKTLILEELFMKEQCRGKGYGRQFFDWLFNEYQDVVRFRLEVTETNEGASSLYKRLGFDYLQYKQMVYDKKI
ncbi:GNAT family N-acetyltransferase [Metaclostridioides mangenotii]|uniref:GNAT family N-acetyltransferase n=1 Tax=Metaclostridioides mangenotii TaxID=1540 RepID=UPI0028E487D8|nr:GNAT family N-acetyltransferase [Clostridioides mangenotii]